MPVASTILSDVSTAPAGSTAAVHMNSILSRFSVIGLNLTASIDALSANDITEVVTANLATTITTNTTANATASIPTLSASISCP